MLIRTATPRDLPAVTDLVAPLWAVDALWGPGRSDAYTPAEDRVVLVAVAGEAIAGVASMQRSTRAAFGLLHLDVRPDHQITATGRALLKEIRRLHPEHSMMTRVRPWDTATLRVLAENGFHVVETVLEGWLQPVEPALSAWIDSALATVPAPITITTVASDDLGHLQSVAAVLHDWYERHHPWLPPPLRTTADAVAAFVLPAIPGTIHSAAIDDDVVGAGLLIPDPFGVVDRGAHLTYLGTGDPHPLDRPIVEGLAAACLAAARAQERPVQVEVSDAQQPMWATINALPPNDLYVGLQVLVG